MNFIGAHIKKPPEKKKKGTEALESNVQTAAAEPQPLTSPPSVKFKIHKSATSAADVELLELRRETDDEPNFADDQEELMTYVLTEDIFVEILAARLQVKSFDQTS